MKFLEKLISLIFSIIVLILAVTVILLAVGRADISTVNSLINNYILNEEYTTIVVITAALFIIAAFKITVFHSDLKSKSKAPILVDSKNGKIEIAQDTIDNTVKNVASSFSEIRDVQAKMDNCKKGIKLYVVASVVANTNIRELTEEMQEKIKTTVLDTTGINVLSIDVKIKNIYEKNARKVETKEVEVEKKETPVSQVVVNTEKEKVNEEPSAVTEEEGNNNAEV